MTVPVIPGTALGIPDPTTYGANTTDAGSTGGVTTLWGLPAYLADTQLWFDTTYGQSEGSYGGRQDGDRGPGSSYTAGSKYSHNVMLTGNDVFKNLAAESQNNPSAFIGMQIALRAAGYYGSAKTIQGGFNQSFKSNLAQALEDYYQVSGGTGDSANPTTGQTAGAPLSFMQFLQNQSAANAATGGGGSGAYGSTPATQVTLADPVALRAQAQNAAQAALGHGLSKAELEKFVSHFQSAQTSEQTSNAGSVTTPDASSEAMQFAQQQDPQGYSNHQAQAYSNALLDLFLPSGSQRASISPVAVGT